jgi:hypothetical protein
VADDLAVRLERAAVRSPEPRLAVETAGLPSISDHPEHPQDDQDHGDDDQRVDDAARVREAGTHSGPEEAQEPENRQYHNDCPKHVSPLHEVPVGRID